MEIGWFGDFAGYLKSMLASLRPNAPGECIRECDDLRGKTMKTLMLIVGVLAVALGLLWAGQGAGYIHWPPSSAMINDVRWTYYGIAAAVIGIGLIWYSRR